jgi:hypothetical protein
LVLTVDELRAMSRSARFPLPGFVAAGDAGDARVDAAAVRGLAVRGLVTISPDQIEVHHDLDRRLAPFATANQLVEVELETAGHRLRQLVAGTADRPAGVLTAPAAGYGTGFVTLDAVSGSWPAVVEELCRLGEVTGPAGAAGFTVDADVQAESDEFALAADRDRAASALAGAGVPAASAAAWVDAVCTRRCAVAVSVVRSLGGGTDAPVELRELRWLAAGDGTAWHIAPGMPTAGPDPDGHPATAVVTPAGPEDLAAGLVDLLAA